ncbi:MAG: mannonate dehydratase [Oscillospiraceae bacterium]|jgi:mannonate dehydratase|nr:mannonate dehydratase [Oscillospiraceae bacterium]
MKMTVRWYGDGQESIPLSYIKQIPRVSGVVTSLLYKQAGEVWEPDECKKMADNIRKAGLDLEVIESVNIHEDIKLGLPSRDEYIENYIKTVKNLREIGIKVICYNFMPVLDWARSDLFYELPDGSQTMRFDDSFIRNTTPKALADKYKKDCGGIALPGWEPERLANIEKTLLQYEGMTEDKYFANAKYFLDAIIPTCEECGIKMAIHPDDPPFNIFGLPRLINNRDHIARFLSLNDSVYNGLTLCTGSLGADKNNDVPAIITEFLPRIHFTHIRNLKFQENGNFYESSHQDGSLDIYKIVKAFHDGGFEGYCRPDHGRMIWGEKGRAGYGLCDRALGIAYINGIWEALERNT